MKNINDEGIRSLGKYTEDSRYTQEKLQMAIDAALKKLIKR